MKLLSLYGAASALLLGSVAPPPADPPPRFIAATAQALPPPPPPVVAPPQPAAPAPRRAASEPLLPPPPGGVRVVVSIPAQRIWVFKGGVLVDSAPVSTGRKGHETPAGTFPILQKKVHHRSNRYSNAPMPYMQRLTWTGIALHAGPLPGYRASHGCIRLPRAFARKLYGLTNFSTRVVVTHARPKSAKAALAIVSPSPASKRSRG